MASAAEETGFVLVTVGTTEFAELVAICVSEEFVEAVEAIGASGVVLQIGRQPFEALPEPLAAALEADDPELDVRLSMHSMSFRVVRFVPGIADLVRRASVVVSHAGELARAKGAVEADSSGMQDLDRSLTLCARSGGCWW
jgi:UDP-N-acetylglucosamine transferase subunit ALG13